jgi:hypothetical protein
MHMGRAVARPYTPHRPAHADFAEALALMRGADDPLALGYLLSHYGLFLCVDGDATTAQALHEEMLKIARSLGDDNLRAEAHYDLAMDGMSAADLLPAEAHLAFAVTHYRDLDHLDGRPVASARSARSPWSASTETSPPGSSERAWQHATASD